MLHLLAYIRPSPMLFSERNRICVGVVDPGECEGFDYRYRISPISVLDRALCYMCVANG
jgi:hypothetical protein